MLHPNQAELLAALARHVALRKTTQQALAEETGVHQSQVSRILAGDARRASKNVLKLCKYAESLMPGEGSAVGIRDGALSELESLLGRSPREDAAILHVIASLHAWRQTWAGDR